MFFMLILRCVCVCVCVKEDIMHRKKNKITWCDYFDVASMTLYEEFVWLWCGKYAAMKLIPFLLVNLGVFIHLAWTYFHGEANVSLANQVAHWLMWCCAIDFVSSLGTRLKGKLVCQDFVMEFIYFMWLVDIAEMYPYHIGCPKKSYQ